MLVANWAGAVMAIFKADYFVWSNKTGHALMYTVVCIDAGLRVFSVTHTGLW